nr:GNAT family N-acetyltransferase [Nocardia inohanensis]
MTFTFQRLTRAEFPLLAKWLANSHVARWWNHETSPEALERDFGAVVDGAEPAEDLLAFRNGIPLGLIQRCRLADYPEYLTELQALTEVPPEAMTIDYLIGEPGDTNRGEGTAMIRALVAQTWTDRRETDAIVVAVSAGNTASWRALERAGFQRVSAGPMDPDNPIDDPLHYVYRIDRPQPAR